nr:MAG TPA: hypothetical protein [Caudoviricetes sp.]
MKKDANFGLKQAFKAMDDINLDGIFSDFDENDRLIMSTLVQKLKENKDFNPLSELPEKAHKMVHELAQIDKSKANDTLKLVEVARSVIKEYEELEDLNKEKEDIKDLIYNTENKIHDIITNQKTMMEKRMQDAADKETDPEKKEKLLNIITAFKDGYSFDKLLDVVKSEYFKKCYLNKKYYKRSISDFDYLIQESMKNDVSIKKVHDVLKLCKLFKITDKEIKLVCLALGVAAHNVIPSDKPQCWYLFTLANNIITLCYEADKTDETQKRRENFVWFVNEANLVVDNY